MAKQKKEFITRSEFDAGLKEMNALSKKLREIDWQKNRKEYDAAEAEYEAKRDLLQGRIDELANHDVINMIAEAGEYGINPSNALSEWITSWC